MALLACTLLARCATSGQIAAGAATTVSAAQQHVQAAINLYGIAKGMGEVAAIADPALAPVIGGMTGILDPMVSQAQAALNGATTDANALEALAAAITSQANTLTAAAAPKITVVPNKTGA